MFGVPDGIRTRVTAVKGRCPNRWTTGTHRLSRNIDASLTLTIREAHVKGLHILVESSAHNISCRKPLPFNDALEMAHGPGEHGAGPPHTAAE